MQRIERAILIDDEQFEHLAFHRLLAGTPNTGEVLSFHYADEALEFLTRTSPRVGDVIFLDINMPRMNGFEFLDVATDSLGDRLSDAVIVMLTTSLNPSDKTSAIAYPAVRDFLNKPLLQNHISQVRHLIPAAALEQQAKGNTFTQ